MKISTVQDDRQSFLGKYAAGDFSSYDYAIQEPGIYELRHQTAPHPHTEKLSQVIENYMSDLELTALQRIISRPCAQVIKLSSEVSRQAYLSVRSIRYIKLSQSSFWLKSSQKRLTLK